MRISFDRRFLPTSFSYSQDVVKYNPTVSRATSTTKYELVATQRILTDHKGIKLCGVLGNNCKSARCAQCSRYQMKQYFSRVKSSTAFQQSSSAVMLTLTFENKAVGNLSDGYKELSQLWAALTKSSWLNNHCEGFAQSTEVVFNTSTWTWNLHKHVILVGLKTDSSPQKIIQRWITKALENRVYASALAQHTRPVDNLSKAVSYTYKDYLTRSTLNSSDKNSSSLTPGDLLALASTGDAPAMELFGEYETASRGHRVRGSGGTLKAIPLTEYRDAQQAKRDAEALAGR